jgi:4-carboxymuconolactone decarboxylase
MSRIPDIVPEKLSAEQRRVYDAVVAGPRGQVVGPLRVWVHNPGLADPAQALGAYCRYGTNLPPRLLELAILIAGAYWKAGFEWAHHAPLGIKAGLDPAAVEQIRVGGSPRFAREDEQAVYDFATELLTTRRVPPPIWDRARILLGTEALIDIVGILGYYSLISLTINAFEVPLPPGAAPPFENEA